MPNNTAFESTLDYLYSRLPVFQLQGKEAINYKLDKTLQFLAYTGNPHQKLQFIHVGGTNGKGSVSHMLSSILQEAGYKVGLYTSPHLKSFTERIKINGQEIEPDFVVNWVETHKSFIETLKPSFFEATVVMSLDYFFQEKVDVVILEVGMGGRLDSTNVVHPLLSVITNISMDHAQYLGDTLDKIAFEKAGIIKKQVPVVIGETQEGIQQVFIHRAQQQEAHIVFADKLSLATYSSDLKGVYQQKNIQTVLAAVHQLNQQGWNVTETNIEEGLEQVVHNTGLKGRWQILHNQPEVVCDTGHNEAGMAMLMDQVQREAKGQCYFVLGFVKEKALEKIMNYFPKEGKYYFCGGQNSRLASPEDLKVMAEQKGIKAETVNDVNNGIQKALAVAQQDDFIFVGGSTFVVAEIEGL